MTMTTTTMDDDSSGGGDGGDDGGRLHDRDHGRLGSCRGCVRVSRTGATSIIRGSEPMSFSTS